MSVLSVLRWSTQYPGGGEMTPLDGKDIPAGLDADNAEYVLASDYDALAAQLAEAKQTAGKLQWLANRLTELQPRKRYGMGMEYFGETPSGEYVGMSEYESVCLQLAKAERLLREIAEHDEWSPWQEPCRAYFGGGST
jgi:hypothetical protein